MQIPSCPGLSRASTSLQSRGNERRGWPGLRLAEGAPAPQAGHGHDEASVTTGDLPSIPLPPSIRSRYVDGINGLRMHVLEAGFETRGRPCVLLLHGFPELAFSWRKVMPALADAGFHVIAPDQRGYGRTTGWDADYDDDLNPFRLLNLVRDALGLVSAFGYRSIDAVIGHDFGSPVAAWCALVRPDVFRSVVMMSAPFGGPPRLPFDTADAPARRVQEDLVHRELAALPRPRKHYHWYYSTREANDDMHHAPQGVHDFLRAYYHHKSADWKANQPHPLRSWSASELAKLPTYYVMDLAKTMPAQVAEEMPSSAEIAANTWLPDSELAFYAAEYRRTGFQGGLLRHLGRIQRRIADLVGQDDRRAILLHLRQAGLGHLSASRRL